MKNSNFKMMKIIPINNYLFSNEEAKNSITKSDKNINELIHEFCVLLLEIIERFCLNKLSTEFITKELLKNISKDQKFIELKNKLMILQVKRFLFRKLIL